MNLDSFERQVPSETLKRGQKYYEDDHVSDLEEVTPGEWEAEVEGSDTDYVVGISLNSRTITDSVCTCPYAEQGNVCKHIVAVILEIRNKLPLKTDTPKDKQENLAHLREIVGETAPAVSNKPLTDTLELYEAWKTAPEVVKNTVAIAALAYSGITPTSILEVYSDSMWPLPPVRMIQEATKLATATGWVTKKGADVVIKKPFGVYLCLLHRTDREFQPVIRKLTESAPRFYWSYTEEYILQKLFLAACREDTDVFKEKWTAYNRISGNRSFQLLKVWLPDSEADRQLLLPLIPKKILALLLYEQLSWYFDENEPYEAYYHALLSSFDEMPDTASGANLDIVLQYAILRGDWPVLEHCIPKFPEEYRSMAYSGIYSFIQGDHASALTFFNNAQLLYKKVNRSKNNALGQLPGVFYALALLAQGEAGDLAAAQRVIEQGIHRQDTYATPFMILQSLLFLREGKKGGAIQAFKQIPDRFSHPVFRLLYNVTGEILEKNSIPQKRIDEDLKLLGSMKYEWAINELTALSDQPLRPEMGTPIIARFPRVEDWVLALNALLQVSEQSTTVTAKENDTRLIWLVNFERKDIEAKEQTFGKKGWSAGRAISDNRLSAKDVKSATQQDFQIMSALFAGSNRGYYYYSKNTSSAEVWKAVAGHPLLFLSKSPTVSVELIEESPALVSQETETGYELRFEPHINEDDTFLILKETPTRYKFYPITDEHRRIAGVFNGQKLQVPQSAFEQFSKAVSGLANRIPVRSSFDVLDPNMPEVPADARPCVHLLPVGDGFHLELFVKPFASIPPYFRPGEGESGVVALIDGQRVRANRDLSAETKAIKALRKNVTVLNEQRPKDQVWEIENADACLSVLAELHPILAAGTITLEWPKGEKFKVTRVVDIDQFRLKIKKENNWFEVSGGVQIDETRVLNVQELLALSERQKSPFVEIRPGEFLAISAAFRKKLEAVNGLMNKAKGGAMQLHPLAATAFEELTNAVPKAEIDKAFEENRKKIQKAFAQKFKLPTQFNAELRPYQQEGFEWLHRMAAWGAGACLADDMGLGKTIQALAFLTDRASQGPALVVAPVSVCRNWIRETEKFAPALRPILFGEGQREAMLREAGKGDLIIATYDLLTRESDLFIEKKWATIVLDEAQAIKNRTTKRSETAMQLQGDFRLIMSGTPVENHLGELWNLFQFANPGLLGGIEQFNERFALPIEKYKDESRRDQLRRLVQPFILRRRKDEVLKDLPAKTEIVLQVELNDDERAFYEALRRKAIENLENPSDDMAAGEQHLRILAEIMKLRRAACHPRLADATVAGFLDSSKLRLFGEVVSELIENGHRALVFSQFVAHLAILREYLDKEKITYQYLDGQTPSAKRQKSIEAFQKGEGDLFLISLKAGGTGLNLTAADYVLHMDPWWNPAVEDQATDRAHRIGQEKPVTVYRLVAAGTIEEKILQLHEQKRDLADSLLSGTGESAKLSAEDLMRLLKERD